MNKCGQGPFICQVIIDTTMSGGLLQIALRNNKRGGLYACVAAASALQLGLFVFYTEGAITFIGIVIWLALTVATLIFAHLWRQTQARLQLYQDALAALPYAASIYDKDNYLIDFNEAYRSVHKQCFEKHPNIRNYADIIRTSAELRQEDNIEQLLDESLTAQRLGDGKPVDRLYPNGHWLRVSKHKTTSGAVIGVGIDITELKQRELQLYDSEKRYHALTQIAPVGILQLKPTGDIDFANDAFLDILGITREQFEKSHPLEHFNLLQGQETMTAEASQARLLRGKHPQNFEATYCHRGTDKILYIARSKLLTDNAGLAFYVFVVLDVTARKRAEEDIRYLAEHDPLTGLANRSTLNFHIHQLLKKSEPFALVLLDLDHFKDVNDSLGHQIGDQLIKEAANRVRASLRQNDMASRLGGDEFAIILHGITKLDQAKAIVKRLYERFRDPVIVEEQVLQMSTSAGIALHPIHGTIAQELIQHADIALYHQKKMGRGSFTLFEAELGEAVTARKVLEQDLRRALTSGRELSVNYQPQYHLRTLEISGVEALVRWKNARTDHWVSPAEFIPIAEQSGLIYQLDRFVLNTAAKQVHQWHRQGYKGLVLASNLSTLHFRGEALEHLVRDVLKESHISPQYLELEITEGIFLQEQCHATEILDQFRKQGIKVAIDDFGTGYSNLGYLNNLPVDSLKIDRSFIDNFDKNSYYRSIVNFIIELGKNLGLDIIAEGIETEAQLKALTDLGCSHAQGYYLSRPKPAEEITQLLKQTPIRRSGTNN